MEILDQPNSDQTGKTLESVLQNGYEFKLGDYVSQGFKMFGADAGIYIAFAFVYFIITSIVQSIPLIGPIGAILVGPPLAAGWYIYARLQKRNETRGFGNFFDGFKANWLHLVLQNLITSIFTGIAVAIVILPFFMGTFVDIIASLDDIQRAQGDQEAMQALMLSLFTGKLIFGILLAIIVASLIAVLYSLAPMFIVFRGMQFWDAMEASRKVVAKNYIQFALFMLLLMIIGLVGFILCCIGLLAAVPIIYLAIFSAYHNIMEEGGASAA